MLWQVARQRSDGDQLVVAGLGQLVMGVTFIPLFYGRAPLIATEREVLALFCTPTERSQLHRLTPQIEESVWLPRSGKVYIFSGSTVRQIN